MVEVNKRFDKKKLENISDVYKTQFGGDKEKFQTAINTQYGEGAFDKVKDTIQTSTSNQDNQQQLTQDQLKQKIATGNFSASEARQYNQMTGSKTGARDVALTSQEAVGANTGSQFKTQITPEEAQKMKNAGIEGVSKQRITAETPEAPEITQPPKVEETQAPTKIETIEQFKQAGTNVNNLEQFIENRYGTTAQIDGNKVIADLNGDRYEWTIDSAGNPIKRKLGRTDTFEKTETEITADLTNKKQQVIGEFDKVLNSSPSQEDITSFIRDNKDFTGDLKTELRNYFKNKNNLQFFQKYSNYNAQELFNAYKNGKIVVGDEKYNLLPGELRQEFENLQRLEQSKTTGDAFNFTDYNDKITSFDDIFSKVKDLFSTNLRQEYEDKINSPEMSAMKEEMSSKAGEINDLDNTIKNLEDDLRDKYPGISEGRLQALVRKDQKELYRKRDDLVASYKTQAQEYQLNKEEIEYGLEVSKYEDTVNRQAFGVALNMYNTEREMMAEEERREFEIEQAELSYQRDLATKKEIILFQEAVNKNKGGQYIDDGQGNLQYVKDGQIISTLKGLGKNISNSDDDNFDYKFYQNDDGSYTAFSVDKKNNKISQQTFDINGNKAGGYLNSLGTGNVTQLGGPHDGWTGIDIDGEIGDPIFTPTSGRILKVEDYGNKTYGKSILVELEDGKQVRYSHLDKFNGLKVGDYSGQSITFDKGAILGTMGNTGYTIPGKGGDGSHVDIVVYDEDGNAYNANQGVEYMNSLGVEPLSTEYDKASVPDYEEYLKTGTLTTASIERLEKEFGSIQEFKRQAEIYNNSEGGPRERELKKVITLRNKVKGLLDNKTAIDDSTGAIQKPLFPWDLSNKNAFLGEIKNLLDKNTLQNLIDVKAAGATFGALSNEELRMLQNAANEISALTILDDEGQVTGFKGGTANFKKKLEGMLTEYNNVINEKLNKMGQDVISLDSTEEEVLDFLNQN